MQNTHYVLSLTRFLTKLLTEDLPLLFVRPKKIVLDFQKGTALGPVADNFRTDANKEGNKDFVGELSVTLVDARKLAYVIFGNCLFFAYLLDYSCLYCANMIYAKPLLVHLLDVQSLNFFYYM